MDALYTSGVTYIYKYIFNNIICEAWDAGLFQPSRISFKKSKEATEKSLKMVSESRSSSIYLRVLTWL